MYILLVLIKEKSYLKKIFCTLLRFPACILPTIHNNINICKFLLSLILAGQHFYIMFFNFDTFFICIIYFFICIIYYIIECLFSYNKITTRHI